MPAVDLARWLQQNAQPQIDLLQIPGERLQLASVPLQATLQEAQEQLQQEGVEALFVRRMTAPGIFRVYGVLTAQTIRSAYRY